MKVSIITVCKNSEKTIEQTIESVAGQTYKEIEYIVIDGASTDSTLNILEKYRTCISVLVSEKDNGLYDAMNKGIAVSTGEIIAILNSDDWYEPNAIETVVMAFASGSADIVYGAMNVVYEDGTQSNWSEGDLEDLPYRMSVPHPAEFVRREVYDRIGNFDIRYQIAADYEFTLRAYAAGMKFQKISARTTFFRDNGLSNVSLEKAAEEVRKISCQYLKYFDEKFIPKIEASYHQRMDYAKIKTWEKELAEVNLVHVHEIADTIHSGRDIIVFGMGIRGKESIRFLKKAGFRIQEIWDNDETKLGTVFEGIPVKKIRSRNEERRFIIISSLFHVEAISRQLETLGYKKEEDFGGYFDLIHSLKETIMKTEADYNISLREDIEWVNKWVEDADKQCRRVLTIGDSVARQYRTCLNDCLKSEGYVADLLAVSYSIFDPRFMKEIEAFLETEEYKYDHILFHVGAHHGYRVRCLNDEGISKLYTDKLLEILHKLDGYCGRLFVVTGTLENEQEYSYVKDDGHNPEIIVRNHLLTNAAKANGWEVIDLNSHMLKSGFRYIDWVHFEDAAKSYIADLLANAVIKKNKNYNISNYIANMREFFEKLSGKSTIYIYGDNRKARILLQYLSRKGILCENIDNGHLGDGQNEKRTEGIIINTISNFREYLFLDKSGMPYITLGKKIYEYMEEYLAVE